MPFPNRRIGPWDSITKLAAVIGGGSSGDVVGPGSSTDNALARFDGITGKIIQGSGVLLGDDDMLRFPDTKGIEDASGNIAIQINDGGQTVLYDGGVQCVHAFDSFFGDGIALGSNTNQVEILNGAGNLWNVINTASAQLIVQMVSGTMLRVTDGADVKLSYNGAPIFATIDDGFNFGQVDVGELINDSTDVYLTNRVHGGNVIIRGENATGTLVTLIDADPDEISITVGYLKGLERSSDPAQPAEGEFVIWLSDGTEKGDDGDVLIASTAGGATNYNTIFDHSAGIAW